MLGPDGQIRIPCAGRRPQHRISTGIRERLDAFGGAHASDRQNAQTKPVAHQQIDFGRSDSAILDQCIGFPQECPLEPVEDETVLLDADPDRRQVAGNAEELPLCWIEPLNRLTGSANTATAVSACQSPSGNVLETIRPMPRPICR